MSIKITLSVTLYILYYKRYEKSPALCKNF